jgi:hypothetical protein
MGACPEAGVGKPKQCSEHSRAARKLKNGVDVRLYRFKQGEVLLGGCGQQERAWKQRWGRKTKPGVVDMWANLAKHNKVLISGYGWWEHAWKRGRGRRTKAGAASVPGQPGT